MAALKCAHTHPCKLRIASAWHYADCSTLASSPFFETHLRYHSICILPRLRFSRNATPGSKNVPQRRTRKSANHSARSSTHFESFLLSLTISTKPLLPRTSKTSALPAQHEPSHHTTSMHLHAQGVETLDEGTVRPPHCNPPLLSTKNLRLPCEVRHATKRCKHTTVFPHLQYAHILHCPPSEQ